MTSKLLILKNALFDHKSWASSTQVSREKKYLLLKVAFIDSQSGIYRKIERYTTHTLICNIFSVLIFFHSFSLEDCILW